MYVYYNVLFYDHLKVRINGGKRGRKKKGEGELVIKKKYTWENAFFLFWIMKKRKKKVYIKEIYNLTCFLSCSL